MFSWIGRSVSSAGGKQTILAITGLTLVGYLVLHLLGNLTLYTGGVEGLNEYSASLEALGVLLQVAEIGLLVLFVLHVGLALRITRENNLARADSEQAQASLDTPPATGPTLAITGLVVLAFLVIHLIDFRVPNLAAEIDDLGGALVERLAQPLGAGLYLVGVLALGMHMWHAIPRAIQTLWPDPSPWSPLLRGLETTLPVLLTVGFASFPIYCLLTRAGGP